MRVAHIPGPFRLVGVGPSVMVSFTKQTERRRRIRLRSQGKTNKVRQSTPLFPIQPEGYDANAPDAKRPEKPLGKSK